jgi:hypothetical protein
MKPKAPRTVADLLRKGGGGLVSMDHCHLTDKPRWVDWILGTITVIALLGIAFLVPG